MADGGEVKHFCASENMHKDDCEYYMADGGLTGEMPAFEETQDAMPAFEETQDHPTESLPAFEETEEPSLLSKVGSGLKQAADLPLFLMTHGHHKIGEPGKAEAEGLASGLLGGTAKAAEVRLGMDTPENIQKREEDFPALQTGSKIVGRAAGMAGAQAAIGPGLLADAVTGFGYAGSDEFGGAMLGQEDADYKSAAISTILNGGANTLLNTATRGLFNSIGGSSRILKDPETVRRAKKALETLSNNPINKAAAVVAPFAAKAVGLEKEVGAAEGAYLLMKKYIDPYLEKVMGQRLTDANRSVGDAVLRSLMKSNYWGVPTAMRYAATAAKNINSVTPALDPLFKSGVMQVTDGPKKEEIDSIKEWLQNSGVEGETSNPEPQNHAKGGEISSGMENNHFGTLYPRENIVLNQAKGRVSNYLNSIRPLPNQSKKPFDSEPSNKLQNRSYEKAISLAAKPISILNHVNDGTLTPELMKHFSQMWPEAHSLLSRKMTERIVKAQLSGEKPDYKKRQMMSLFLGTDLDSTFSQQSIMAVQSIYAAKGQQGQPGPEAQTPKTQKSTSSLSKLSPSYLSNSQARVQRQQNLKS